ncbi:MAG TPA: methyltransferase domain-containing protein, partial [Rhodanobacteraceae bacterium]|nr:methyltransferase domain-containing protein [Rhodanobacteraceae bacterium]
MAQRRLEGELMDDPALAVHAHHAALHGLQRINRASRTAATLWPPIARILSARPGASASLLDVACGGGDVAIALARRAHRHGFALSVEGCDISDTALQHAALDASHAGELVKFFHADVLSEALPQRYTFIISTLFLHHLSDAQIVELLRKLAANADHLLISDLIRGRSGYTLAWFGTRLLSRSHIVHEDGLRSVRAALTLDEARALAEEAGLHGA